MPSLAAVVLAAGNSSRMGKPKALLEYGGDIFIERVCAALRLCGVGKRVVVLGRDAAAVTAAWKPSGETIVVNPAPDLGQLSSLRVGLEAAGGEAEGYAVCLSDQPAIQPATYKEIVSFWSAHRDAIVIPRCERPGGGFKRGHPIIIPAVFRHLCFEGPLDKGLHWVTHHPEARTADVEVKDKGILFDCDSPEDYRALLNGDRR